MLSGEDMIYWNKIQNKECRRIKNRIQNTIKQQSQVMEINRREETVVINNFVSKCIFSST